MADAAAAAGLDLKLASPSFSTDNAAMIAYAALERYLRGYRSDLSEDADPNLKLDELSAGVAGRRVPQKSSRILPRILSSQFGFAPEFCNS